MTNFSEIEYSLELREDMVRTQLQRRGIDQSDILEAFMQVPRHCFIPDLPVDDAYSDRPQPIQAGQTISQPYMVALMLTYLELQKHHRVLEIGSGSGYATALLSRLSGHVDAVEVYKVLKDSSQVVLDQLGIENVRLTHQSAWEQSASDEVYDRIILWASPARIPEHLYGSLKEGGILVAPEGKSEQFVWVIKKQHGELNKIRKDAVRFVPLVQGSVEEIDGRK